MIKSCCNISPLVLTLQRQLSTLVQIYVKWQVHSVNNFDHSDKTGTGKF